jgi:hypothetical protein
LFKNPAEHKHAEHVEKNVSQIGMHEHVGNDLMRFKQGRSYGEKGEVTDHNIRMQHINGKLGQSEKKHIDDNDVLNDRRN